MTNTLVGLPSFDSTYVPDCALNGGTPNASSFCSSYGIAVDASNNLYVSDWGNNRVLEFAAPLRDGAPATAVLGQADFTGGECNGGVFLATDLGGLGPDSFCFSAQGGRDGLAFDGKSEPGRDRQRK